MEWFWEGLEALWPLFTDFLASFFVLVFGMLFRRSLGAIWVRICFDWQGFGRVWGDFWRPKAMFFNEISRVWSDIPIFDTAVFPYVLGTSGKGLGGVGMDFQ